MKATFRLRKSILIQGVAFAIVFAIVVFAHALIFIVDPKLVGLRPEIQDTRLGFFTVSVYGTMLLLSVYSIVAYYVENFSIDGTTLHVRSVFQNIQFDVASLERLIWNAKWKGGKLFFQSSMSKATLALHGYTVSDRLKIIEMLRQIVPEDAQEGWGEFCHFVALPLREGRRVRQPGVEQFDPVTLAEADRVFVTRQYYDRSFGVMFALSVVLAAALYWFLANLNAFMMPLIVIGFWLLLRFSLPKTGRWDAKFSARPGGKEMAYGYLYVFSTIVVMVTLQWVGFNRGTACLVASALALPALVWCIRGKFRTANQQRAQDTEQVSKSIESWNAGNSKAGTDSFKPVLF